MDDTLMSCQGMPPMAMPGMMGMGMWGAEQGRKMHPQKWGHPWHPWYFGIKSLHAQGTATQIPRRWMPLSDRWRRVNFCQPLRASAEFRRGFRQDLQDKMKAVWTILCFVIGSKDRPRIIIRSIFFSKSPSFGEMFPDGCNVRRWKMRWIPNDRSGPRQEPWDVSQLGWRVHQFTMVYLKMSENDGSLLKFRTHMTIITPPATKKKSRFSSLDWLETTKRRMENHGHTVM